MKIEMAESLFLSWLRHVRGCQIAQLNWKPSQTWVATNREKVETLFNNSRGFFFQEKNLDLYGKNSSVSQLVQQAEIDAIGFCDLEERPSIIAVDVAFHESGLNYGGKNETVSRVVKKVLRTLLALESYFADYSREIIFAAPKIHNAVQGALDEAMIAVDQFLEQNDIAAEFRVIANDEFFSEIVEPVRKLSSEVADTSELFMRSVQLMGMAPKTLPSPTPITNLQAVNESTSDAHEQKIGEIVRERFRTLFEQKQLTDAEVAKLCTGEYSKRTFGIRYPALKRSNNTQDRFDESGNARYYSKVFGGKYLLCNDWYERNRERFGKWLASLEGDQHVEGQSAFGNDERY